MNREEVIALLDEREKLADEKRQLSEQLVGLGISGNRAYFSRGTIEKDIWATRIVWAKRVAELEKRLGQIKALLRIEKDNCLEGELKHIKEILTESIDREFMVKVFSEARRRAQGQPALAVRYSPEKKQVKSFRYELLAAVDLLLKARTAINDYIITHEPEVNKADYLREISPLNKCLPSTSELNKMKP